MSASGAYGTQPPSDATPNSTWASPGQPVQQKQRMTALPISVTTASRANPEGKKLSDGPATQRLAALGMSPSITQSSNTSRMGLAPILLASTSAPRPEHGITLSSGVAFRGGGITLPNNAVKGRVLPPKIQSTAPIRRILSSKSSSNLPASSNPVYSSASRASVNAHQLALERRINSAPGSLVGLRSPSEGPSEGGKYKYQKVFGGKQAVPKRSGSMSFEKELSPQLFLDGMLKSRGYCTRNYCSLEGGYYCKPTVLQTASYGTRLIEVIRHSNEDLLKKMLESGISPNPCNAFGESAIHMVCRRGDYKLLKVLKDAGCSLQVTDDFGRTPLHDACWTADPHFEIVEMILDTDERLLHMVDCRGSSPLSYIKRESWAKWIAFFQSKVEKYWPERDISKQGEEPPPVLCSLAQHSQPIKDPANAIPLDAAQLISSGKMTPDDYLAVCGARPATHCNIAVPPSAAPVQHLQHQLTL